jgi:Amino acid permease
MPNRLASAGLWRPARTIGAGGLAGECDRDPRDLDAGDRDDRAVLAYQGIALSEKALIITGSIEILIMVALAISGLVSTGPGGFSWGPLNPGNFHLSSNLFLGVVFSIFAFSGWESTGPMAEESKNPKRNVPIGLVGSVVVLMIYFVFVTWGYLNGIGVHNVRSLGRAVRLPRAAGRRAGR